MCYHPPFVCVYASSYAHNETVIDSVCVVWGSLKSHLGPSAVTFPIQRVISATAGAPAAALPPPEHGRRCRGRHGQHRQHGSRERRQQGSHVRHGQHGRHGVRGAKIKASVSLASSSSSVSDSLSFLVDLAATVFLLPVLLPVAPAARSRAAQSSHEYKTA
jgi:hypothetical protein